MMALTAVWNENPLEVLLGEDHFGPARVRADYFTKALRSPESSKKGDTEPDTVNYQEGAVASYSSRNSAQLIELPRWKRLPGIGRDSLAALQEWEGVITHIEAGKFFASLVDITSRKSHVTEVAEIPIEEVSEQDRGKIAPGAIFRLVIGFRKSNGQKYNTSHIYFRRLPLNRAPLEENAFSLVCEDE